jgi:hypothetical protein
MARIINGLISVGEPKGAYKLELERNTLLWIDPSRHRTSSSASDAIHCRGRPLSRGGHVTRDASWSPNGALRRAARGGSIRSQSKPA